MTMRPIRPAGVPAPRVAGLRPLSFFMAAPPAAPAALAPASKVLLPRAVPARQQRKPS